MRVTLLLVFLYTIIIITLAKPWRRNHEEDMANRIKKRSIDSSDDENLVQRPTLTPARLDSRNSGHDATSSINWRLLSADPSNLAIEMKERRKRSSVNPGFSKANRRKRQSVVPIHQYDEPSLNNHESDDSKSRNDAKYNFDQLSEKDLTKLAYLIHEMQRINDENDRDYTEYFGDNRPKTRQPIDTDFTEEQDSISPYEETFYRDQVLQHPKIAFSLLRPESSIPPEYYGAFLHPKYTEKRRLSKRSLRDTTDQIYQNHYSPEFYKDVVLVNPIEIAKSFDVPVSQPSFEGDGRSDDVLVVDLPSLKGSGDRRHNMQRLIDADATNRRRFSIADDDVGGVDLGGRRKIADDAKHRRRPAADDDADDSRWRHFYDDADFNDSVLSRLAAAYGADGVDLGGAAEAAAPFERRLSEFELEKRIASLARYLNARKRRFK